MTYLAKDTLLWAYKKLSTLSEDPSLQGATQKISAIRYALALDMFYKQNNRECDTRDSKDKAEFASYINRIVAISDNLYTPNFYVPLASHMGDCAVGSNFYSVGAVKNSLMNPSLMISYPQRGNKPLFEIQNGKLYRRLEMVSNINSYIPLDEHKFALALWIIGKSELESSFVLSEIDRIYHSIFTDELCDLLRPTYGTDEDLREINFDNHLAIINKSDIENLFEQNHMSLKHPDSLQIIYYGAPGTGKSHEVAKTTKQVEAETKANHEEERVFRTTFHPDSDYSTFVGCYKPTMQSEPQTYVVEGQEKPVIGMDGKQVMKEKIVYNFIPQAFTNAYVRAWLTNKDVYLVIEEINRGNCAQIFGDLFQLLDRDKDGYSKYPIDTDSDLGNHIRKALLASERNDIPEEVKSGKKMQLPSNLYIWATMNTSDQSLFPIDSAFKRRWDWKYMKIKDMKDKIAQPYRIIVKDKQYSWWGFINKMNEHISSTTSSEDKQLGYFFVNREDGQISADDFVNKVLFYLYNDALKDYSVGLNIKNEQGELKAAKFSDFYDDNGEVITEKVQEALDDYIPKEETAPADE